MAIATHEHLDVTLDWTIAGEDAYASAGHFGGAEILFTDNHYSTYWFPAGSSVGYWLDDYDTLSIAVSEIELYASRLVVSV